VGSNDLSLAVSRYCTSVLVSDGLMLSLVSATLNENAVNIITIILAFVQVAVVQIPK